MENVKIVPAICPMCGANITVKPEEDAAVCEYCGRAFIVDKAIEKYDAKYHVDKMEYKGIGYGLGRAKELEQQRKLEAERFDREHYEDKAKSNTRFFILFMIFIFGLMILLHVMIP